RAIPDRFEELGRVIHNDRNILRHDESGNVALVIKSYRRIYLPNRIRYTYFYPSKARRAFDYARFLLDKGFITPKPIAYIECKNNLLLTESYFVSEYTEFQPLKYIRELPDDVQDVILDEIAPVTIRQHII